MVELLWRVLGTPPSMTTKDRFVAGPAYHMGSLRDHEQGAFSMPTQVQHTQNTPTDQQLYALLQATYGHLGATSFTHVLTNKRGQANLLACTILEWVLDWYRPSSTGQPRFKGRLYFPSASLCITWNVGKRSMDEARAIVSRAGLVTFHTVQHTCWIEVHWDAIAAALQEHAEIVENSISKSRPTEKRESEQSRPTEKRESGASDPRKNANILLLGSPLKPTPPTEEEEDVVQHTEGLGCNTPAATLAPARAAGSGEHPADALMALMAERGRPCSGAWAQEAREAWDALVDAGLDPGLIEDAVRLYLAESETRRSHSLAPLNRYLLGQWSCGDLGFRQLYERVQHTRAKKAEETRIAAGGTPTWRTVHIVTGGWVVRGGGEAYELAEMSRAEAIAEAARRWGATHPNHAKEA